MARERDVAAPAVIRVAKKLLALAAISLKARQKPPQILALIETHGAVSSEDGAWLVPKPLVDVLTSRLLEQKRQSPDRVLDVPVRFELADLQAEADARAAAAQRRLPWSWGDVPGWPWLKTHASRQRGCGPITNSAPACLVAAPSAA